MKLNVQERDIESSGFASEASQFRIKTSATMFKLLSSQLYSDKITAVIRELSCNAYDAQVSASNVATPFEVHLPNVIEPFFRIRDFGTGLSDKDVTTLYTTYGESTKADSNDFVGAMGIGSKVGFAYKDQFTVTSYYNGQASTFSAFLAANGEPMIQKLHSVETTEPNGLEITIMVAQADFGNFREKASDVFFRFPVTPKITGGTSEFKLQTVKYALEGKRFKVREETRYGDSNIMAIQGTVAYPISSNNFSIPISPQQSKILNRYSSPKIDIIFPIGELEVAPSREHLSYDERTQRNILKAIDEILLEVESLWEAKCKSVNTIWDAYQLYYNGRGALSGLLDVLPPDKKRVKYKDKVIEDVEIKLNLITKAKKEEGDAVEVQIDYDDYMVRKEEDLEKYTTHRICNACSINSDFLKGHRQTAKPKWTLSPKIYPNSGSAVLFIDSPKHQRILARFVRHNFGNNGVINQGTASLVWKEVHVFFTMGDAEKEKQVLEQLEGIPSSQVFYSSRTKSLQLPPPIVKDVSVAPKQKKSIKVQMLNREYSGSNAYSSWFERTGADIPDKGIYFLTYNTEFVADENDYKKDSDTAPKVKTTYYIPSIFKLVDCLGYIPKDVPVIKVNWSDRSEFIGDDNWVDGYTYIKNLGNIVGFKNAVKSQLAAIAKANELEYNRFEEDDDINNVKTLWGTLVNKYDMIIDEVPKNSKFYKMLSLMKDFYGRELNAELRKNCFFHPGGKALVEQCVEPCKRLLGLKIETKNTALLDKLLALNISGVYTLVFRDFLQVNQIMTKKDYKDTAIRARKKDSRGERVELQGHKLELEKIKFYVTLMEKNKSLVKNYNDKINEITKKPTTKKEETNV